MEITHRAQDVPSKKLGIFISSEAYGGAEKYIDLLGNALNSQSIDYMIIGSLPGFPVRGPKLYALPIGPKWSKKSLLKSIPSALREKRLYLGAARSLNVNGSHLQFKREQILLSKSLSSIGPVLWTEHGLLPKGPYGRILKVLYKRAARHATGILCVSQAVVDDLVGCGIPSSKLRLALNPVNVEEFRSDAVGRSARRLELNLCQDDVAILAMSRLDRHKGINRLIDAVEVLPPNFVLLVAGSGSAEAELRRQAGPLGDRVRFLGFQPNPAQLLRAADVFCFPSTAASGEGVPTMAVLEAMATGLPVVATHDSGLEDWLPERGGIVAGDGPTNIASCIERAFEQRMSLGAAACKVAQEHDISKWSKSQGVYFLEILSRSIPETGPNQ